MTLHMAALRYAIGYGMVEIVDDCGRTVSARSVRSLADPVVLRVLRQDAGYRPGSDSAYCSPYCRHLSQMYLIARDECIDRGLIPG